MWITNGSIADVAVVWARDEDDVIRGFLLEKGMDGFTSSNIHGKMSLRASITSELFMKDVRVSDANRLPNIEGLKGPLSCLTQARYSIVWGVIGAAIDCYEVALSYGKDRNIPFSNKNPRITSSSSLAQTTATSAMEPFVIHILDPLIIQSSPSLFALVSIPAGSEPWFDSVSPKHPTALPAANKGSHFSFCSSVPY